MLTGSALRERTLTSTKGTPVRLRVIRPDATPANAAELERVSVSWLNAATRLVERGHSDPAHRARFASNVALLASRRVERGRCCVLVAVDGAGGVRGIIVYRTDDVTHTWQLDLLSTDPDDQGGNPNPDPVRGIGSELLGAAAGDMATTRCQRVELEPLDAAAERYWRARGFSGPLPHLSMSCPELRALAARYHHSPHDDSDALADNVALRVLLEADA